MEKVRIDKWLWLVRLFKTRTLATDACNAGKVKIDQQNTKPSRELKEGMILQVRVGLLVKTVKVVDSPKSRISPKLVPDFYQDLTSQEEYDRVKMLADKFEFRDHGLGRPTKRDRRQLDYVKNFLADDTDWTDKLTEEDEKE